MIVWFLLLCLGVLSFGLTWALRHYALAKSLLDVPNARSSHSVPTPRGGGVAIVLAFSLGLLVLWLNGALPNNQALALGAGGLWVALIGFLDDHGHIPARWRLLAHFTAAIWAISWLGGLPALPVAGWLVPSGIFWNALAVVYTVWLLNLYNFMDGIDGIAGLEAVSVCAAMVLICWFTLPGHPLWLLPALLGLAAFGFLIWNYPPARIFMGDAGSGFLGFTFGLMPIIAAYVEPQLFWSWLILLSVFVVDATLTLFRRAVRGQKFHEAHRSHAYQYASRLIGSHKPISLAVTAINLLWLFPMGLLVAKGHLDGVAGLLLAYMPLFWLAWHFKAGAAELQG